MAVPIPDVDTKLKEQAILNRVFNEDNNSLTVDGTLTANLSATDNTVLDNIDTAVTSKYITEVGHGVQTVTTAGTDVALAASTVCKRVDIQAQTDNTGLIAVGATGVDATVATGTGNSTAGDNNYALYVLSTAANYIAGDVSIGKTTASGKLHVTQGTINNEVFRIESVATNDDPNYKATQGRVATTDATVTTIETIAIAASNTYLIESRIVARRTGGTGGTADDGAVYIRRAMVTTKAGTVTISAVQDELTQEDQAGWDATFTVSTTNILIQVTGALDNNITWHSTTFVSNVGSQGGELVMSDKTEQVVEDKTAAESFVKEYDALCKKTGFQIVVSPAFIKRDDGTYSIVLQPTVGKMPEVK